MSSDSQPITPARFAAALPSLPLASLHSKAAELHNSIAHLRHSNAQLAPFAIPELRDADTRTIAGLPSGVGTTDDPSDMSYDQDCADAIQENEDVIARMRSRLELLKTEVENRGAVWVWDALDEMAAGKEPVTADAGSSGGHAAGTNGASAADGQLQNGSRAPAPQGSVVNGTANTDGTASARSGRLTDEELRRRMQEQLGDLDEDNDDEDGGGMHL